MPLIPSHRPRRALTLLASALLAASGATAAAPALQEGKGGVITLPGTVVDRIGADAPFLRPGGPRIEFIHALDGAVHDFALHGDVLALACDDGLRLMRFGAGDAPQPLARLALPAPVTKVTIADGVAWLAGPGGLHAVDIREPATPRLLGSHAAGGGTPLDVIVHRGKGYLLYADALHVLALSRDGSPALLTRHALGFEARAMAAADDTLYIAAGADGLYALDANGLHPAFRATGAVSGVAFADGRLYLAGGIDGLTVLTREDGGALRWLGSLRGTRIDTVSVASGHALARGNDDGLFLLDVANPQAMEREALLRPGAFRVARMLAGARALALGTDGLIGFDLDAPPPRDSNEGLALGQGVNFGGQRRIHLEDRLAYVADWFSGLHIYDVGDPRHPTLLSSFHSQGSPKGVVVRGHIAYVADDDHGLRILDVGNPRRPRELARLDLPGLAYTPVLAGDVLYLAAHHGGVLIVDVSDPRAPALLSHYDTPGKSWSLRVQNGVAFVADDDAGLLMLDVGDVRAPRPIGSYRPEGRIEEVIIDGTIAYLALYEGAIHVLDIGDPSRPRLLAQLRTPGNARGLALHGGLLYVADWLAGVHVVDVSDPARPRLVGTRDTDGAAWGIALRGDTALIADWWGGIATLDVSDPARPALLGGYPRRMAVTSSAALDDFVFAAQGDGGVQVFEASNPLNPTWVTGVELRGAGEMLVQGEQLWVLHDGGTRVAAIDVSNPFEAHLSADLALGYRAKALRPAGAAVFVFGEREYTLIDERAGRHQRHALRTGIADATAARDGIVIAARDGSLMTLKENGAPGRALARLDGGAAIQRLVATAEGVLAQLRGEGLRVLDWDGDAAAGAAILRERARIPIARTIDALALDGDRIYLASDLDVQAIDLSPTGAWQVTGAWRMMSAVTTITVHRDTLYFAGADALRALSPAPPAEFTLDADGSLGITVPPLLPPGSYDIGAGNIPFAEPRLRDALRIEPLRLGSRPR